MNGLLSVGFLADTAYWTGEILEITTDCPETLFAEVIAQCIFVHS
jgi:hypothetical protein